MRKSAHGSNNGHRRGALSPLPVRYSRAIGRADDRGGFIRKREKQRIPERLMQEHKKKAKLGGVLQSWGGFHGMGRS